MELGFLLCVCLCLCVKVSGLEVWKVEEERMRRGLKTSLEEVDSLKHLLSVGY